MFGGADPTGSRFEPQRPFIDGKFKFLVYKNYKAVFFWKLEVFYIETRKISLCDAGQVKKLCFFCGILPFKIG